jgi:hypothetical protein
MSKLVLEQETHRILGACFIAPSSALGRPLLILIVIVISPSRWVKEDYDYDYD